MQIRTLKEMIGNQPDDAEVEFIHRTSTPRKIILKVGKQCIVADLVAP